MFPFYVIEDELGALALAVYNKEHTRLIYLNRFYHQNPGMLQFDLMNLANGEDPETQWDNNELTRTDRDHPERLETWFPELTQKGTYHKIGSQWQVIADEGQIYQDQRGAVGKRELSESFYRHTFPKRGQKDKCKDCPYNRPIFIAEIQGTLCEGLCSPYGCYLAR